MSDESVLKDFQISQSNRWYFWSTKKVSISKKEILTHSANMHLIPADASISSGLNAGQIIRLKGKLVRIEADDGWKWKSSVSRSDMGGGSCELIWAEEIRIIN